MSQHTVTFVGGPEDGKRVAFPAAPPPSYRVAILPRLPTYVPAEEATPVAIDFHQFEYVIRPFPGSNLIAYPSDWDNLPDSSSTDRVVTALLRGYVGRR